MAAVAYTSKLADRDFYESEMAREKKEIKEAPALEREEIREIYRKKGFNGKILDEIVNVIVSNKKIWLETMMSDELKLSPVEKKRPFTAAFVVGFSAIIGSLIPLVPFFFVPIREGIIIAIIISAITLFIVGAIKALLTVGNWGRSGLEMAVIGTVSALAGYGIGLLFQA
jgi:predicted membrane protein (TIGR00267 family)